MWVLLHSYAGRNVNGSLSSLQNLFRFLIFAQGLLSLYPGGAAAPWSKSSGEGRRNFKFEALGEVEGRRAKTIGH